ncbi:PIR Superfamily Protein [Plasmodium ovale wallikeri]|uniref:PIR Superfamily Protein n=1 Tax=Plasmodium ovale wallikeri TaxID=864142 RepID=A0A1A9A7J6_PLAOA|nr:PIR Superfamily Protein [Plasmodium ovale wallikeri]
MTTIPGKKVTGKYIFCLNSPYYESLLKNISDNNGKVNDVDKCNDLSTSMMFSEKRSSTEICKEFKFLYKSFNEYRAKDISEKDTFTDYDYDFLNYWINVNLRENVKSGSINVKEFYEKIKNKDNDFFSKNKDLNDYLHVIDPDVLVNMKLLYNLYSISEKIINISDQVYPEKGITDKEQKSCSDYKNECDKNYKEAMDRCLNTNDDFYNALKIFKDSYGFLTEPSSNESNACNSREFFFFPKYDPVPEKEKRIMTIKISSTLSVLSLALPLIYKLQCNSFLGNIFNNVKAREKVIPGKKVDDMQKASPDVAKVSPDGDTKANSPPPEPSSKAGDPSIGKSPNGNPEKSSTQITPSPEADVHPQSNVSNAILDGIPPSEYIPANPNAHASPVNVKGAKKESTPTHSQHPTALTFDNSNYIFIIIIIASHS